MLEFKIFFIMVIVAISLIQERKMNKSEKNS